MLNKRLSILAIIMVLVAVTIIDGQNEKQLNKAASDRFIEYRIAFDEQRYDEAYEMGKSLLRERQDEDVYYLLALSSYALHQNEESVQFFRKVIDLNVNRLAEPLFLLQFAESLVSANDVSEAEKILRRARQIAPDAQYEMYLAQLEVALMEADR